MPCRCDEPTAGQVGFEELRRLVGVHDTTRCNEGAVVREEEGGQTLQFLLKTEVAQIVRGGVVDQRRLDRTVQSLNELSTLHCFGAGHAESGKYYLLCKSGKSDAGFDNQLGQHTSKSRRHLTFSGPGQAVCALHGPEILFEPSVESIEQRRVCHAERLLESDSNTQQTRIQAAQPARSDHRNLRCFPFQRIGVVAFDVFLSNRTENDCSGHAGSSGTLDSIKCRHADQCLCNERAEFLLRNQQQDELVE